jgi:hypothetical protein
MVEQLAKLVHNPKLVYALLITNEEYGVTRTNTNEKLRYDNLKEVVGDAGRVMELFTQVLKIPPDNIKVGKDLTPD